MRAEPLFVVLGETGIVMLYQISSSNERNAIS